MEVIEDRAFEHCESITELVFPSKLKSIGFAACASCTRLTKIVFPESLESIGYGVFSYCYNLTSITILAPNPPAFNFLGTNVNGFNIFATLDGNGIDFQDEKEANCALYVPESAIDKYEDTYGWRNIINISSAIKHITSSATDNEAKAFYELSGRQTSSFKEGVVIVKYNNGSIKKVKK